MATPKECIKEGWQCSFKVTANPKASDKAPWYEAKVASTVNARSGIIEAAAKDKEIDANLIRAIMFMEESHGYYDAPLNLIGENKSIRPMNINVAYWGDTFGTREDMQDVTKNINAGAEMLKRIMFCLPNDAPIEVIATLYNNINAKTVNDYGMRVKKIYEEKLWE